MAGFDAFTEENDPYGEHDFGMFEYRERKLGWKIEYFNADMTAGSSDPANPTLTRRVMTIMLMAEY